MKRKIDEWRATAANLNALPISEKADLALHLAGKYGVRLSGPTLDRLAALERGYEIDHTLPAALERAGITL